MRKRDEMATKSRRKQSYVGHDISYGTVRLWAL